MNGMNWDRMGYGYGMVISMSHQAEGTAHDGEDFGDEIIPRPLLALDEHRHRRQVVCKPCLWDVELLIQHHLRVEGIKHQITGFRRDYGVNEKEGGEGYTR